MRLFHGSIRKKLIILVLLATSPVFLVLIGTELINRQRAVEEATKEAALFLNGFAEVQRRVTDSTRTLLRTVASMPGIKRADVNRSRLILSTLLETNPIYTNAILVDNNGNVIAAGKNHEKALNLNFADRKQFRNAIRTKGFASGEFVVGKNTKKSIFPFGMAVLDHNGGPKGAIIIGVSLEHYKALYSKGNYPEGSFIGMCDHKGLRLFRHPSTSQIPLGSPIKQKVYEAAQKAASLAGNSSKKEQDLIDALTDRYGQGDYDLDQHNKKYLEAIKKVAKKYPQDADVQTFYAAAIMNTMPWNYWDLEGNPNPGTLDGKKALETAMEADPDHPGAHHYYIHMVELPDPDLAVASADKLGSLMPAAGHLVHMPSHIYIRVGRYEDAVKANIAAVAADEDYISQCLAQGIYPLAYYPHNIHFLWSAASLMGDSETAILAGKKTAEKVPLDQLNTLTFLQDYFSTPYLAYTRFGKWNEILTIPAPGEEFKHVSLIWHYARGIAFLRKNNLSDAQEELEAIREIGKDPGLASLIANYTNPSSLIYDVAVNVLAGEISAYGEDYERAIELLEQGVAAEDRLNYSEPSAWHIPVRQTLGSVLMRAELPEQAEPVYLKDLEINRNNGWSLTGLHNSLIAQGKSEEAAQVKETFQKVWGKADIEISDSIL